MSEKNKEVLPPKSEETEPPCLDRGALDHLGYWCKLRDIDLRTAIELTFDAAKEEGIDPSLLVKLAISPRVPEKPPPKRIRQIKKKMREGLYPFNIGSHYAQK